MSTPSLDQTITQSPDQSIVHNGDPAAVKSETELLAKTQDLQALRDAVVDSASVSTGLWLSYVFALFYLAIAAGSITHRDLFYENPVRLPFFNIELPLVAFFVFAPPLLLIIHVYVLLYFVQFADKLGVFNSQLNIQILDDQARGRVRRQLPSNIFVQLLAGPDEIRAGVTGFLLWLVANISLVAAPVLILVLFQIKFLPFHNSATMWERFVILADMVVVAARREREFNADSYH